MSGTFPSLACAQFPAHCCTKSMTSCRPANNIYKMADEVGGCLEVDISANAITISTRDASEARGNPTVSKYFVSSFLTFFLCPFTA